MHDSLCIPEILAQILANIPNNDDLAQVALTCKTLSEPALDELYRHLPNLAYLFMGLPDEIWDNENTRRTFRRMMLPSDWQICRRNMHRVQSLELVDQDRSFGDDPGSSSKCTIEHEMLVAISHYSGLPLLPNLKTLLVEGEMCPLLSLQLLIGPQLEELSLAYVPFKAMPVLIHASRVASLKSLSITNSFNSSEDIRLLDAVLLEAIPAMQSLESLSLDRCRSPQLLEALASLPYLHSLELSTWYDRDGYPELLEELVFPKLKKLSIPKSLSMSPASYIRMLQKMHSSVGFTSLETGIDAPEPELDSYIRALTSSSPDTVMRNLELACYFPGSLDFSFFRPLFTYQHLTRFVLMTSTLTINDDRIAALSLAWPRLRDLTIRLPFNGWHKGHKVTLRGLAILLHNCPDLKEINILVDTTFANNSSTNIPMHGAPFNSRITSITLGDSPIDNAYFVASWLSRMMPRLRHTTWWRTHQGEQEWEVARPKWERVDELLGRRP